MIIGISGKKGSGKTLVTKMLKFIYALPNGTWKDYNNNLINWSIYLNKDTKQIYEYSFAYPIKVLVSTILNCDISLLDNEDFKKEVLSKEYSYDGKYYTVRDLLQIIGTEVGRQITPNIWINAVFNRLNNNNCNIINDVHFINEATAILGKGGVLIRLTRTTSTDLHQSEIELDYFNNFTYIIHNDNITQKELFYKVKGIFINIMNNSNC